MMKTIKEQKLKERLYDLVPEHDSRGSFYGKAKVEVRGNDVTLYSYNTPIVKYNLSDRKVVCLCDENALSATTMRHLREFIQQAVEDDAIDAVKQINKAWVMSLPKGDIDESLEDDDDFNEFVKNHPNMNKDFDRKRFGKYFDKNGEILADKKNDFFADVMGGKRMTEAKQQGERPYMPVEEFNLLYRYFQALISKLDNKEYAAHFRRPEQMREYAKGFCDNFHTLLRKIKHEDDLGKTGSLLNKFDYKAFNSPKKLSDMLTKVRDSGENRLSKALNNNSELVSIVHKLGNSYAGAVLTCMDELQSKKAVKAALQNESLEEDLDERYSQLIKQITPKHRATFNAVKELIENGGSKVEVDGFYFPEDAVEAVSGKGSNYHLNSYMDLTTSDILNMVDDNATVEDAIKELFDDYNASSAYSWGSNFLSALKGINLHESLGEDLENLETEEDTVAMPQPMVVAKEESKDLQQKFLDATEEPKDAPLFGAEDQPVPDEVEEPKAELEESLSSKLTLDESLFENKKTLEEGIKEEKTALIELQKQLREMIQEIHDCKDSIKVYVKGNENYTDLIGNLYEARNGLLSAIDDIDNLIFEDHQLSSRRNESLKLKEGYSVVDLETGDRFGDYSDVDRAKSKAYSYAFHCHTTCAVVDANFRPVCGYSPSGKEISPRGLGESLKRNKKRKSVKENFYLKTKNPKKKLNEAYITKDFSEFEPWSGAVEVWNRILDEDKLDDFEFFIDDVYSGVIGETELNDLLRFDSDYVYDVLGMSTEEDIDESLSKKKLKESVSQSNLAEWLEDSVNWLVENQEGCATYKLDDRLAVCVGWSDGFDDEEGNPYVSDGYGIVAGIKVWTSDDMRTDYDWINAPYDDNEDVYDTTTSISPNENFSELANWLLSEYASLATLKIEKDGKIIEGEEDVDESLKKGKKRNLKEEVSDYAYTIAQRIDDEFRGQGYISWEDFNDAYENAFSYEEASEDPELSDYFSDESADLWELETDVRGVLSMMGWKTIFEGEDEGSLKLLESKKRTNKRNLKEDSWRGLAYYEYPKGSGCKIRETPSGWIATDEYGRTLGHTHQTRGGAEVDVKEYLKGEKNLKEASTLPRGGKDEDFDTDAWSVIYWELSADSEDSTSTRNMKKLAKTSANAKNKYERVDPVNDTDLRVYAKDENGFKLAKKVANAWKVKYEIEPTKKSHQAKFPDERLQMTIFIPEEMLG